MYVWLEESPDISIMSKFIQGPKVNEIESFIYIYKWLKINILYWSQPRAFKALKTVVLRSYLSNVIGPLHEFIYNQARHLEIGHLLLHKFQTFSFGFNSCWVPKQLVYDILNRQILGIKCCPPKKHGFLGLTPVYSETTALSKPYFILKLQSVRKFRRKRLLFKKQNVDFTGYYGIDDPFPDLIS